MMQERRDFLKGIAWMGATAMAAGCLSEGRKLCDSTGAPMHGKGIYAAPPMWGVAGHDVLKYNNAHLRSF